MPVLYADASALVKLLVDEPQSEAVEACVREAELVSSELVLGEVPRALRRFAFEGFAGPLESLLDNARALLERVTMAPLESLLLEAAGELPEPGLRALDAVHVVTAIYLQPIDAFLTCDERQAASARRAGLSTLAPAT